MQDPVQLPLFGEEQDSVIEKVSGFESSTELGTFKDSMRAPVHSWFRYPAGYSFKFVNSVFQEFEVKQGEWVYDPFSGTGTTLVCAKQQGINAYGVEAHSFVHWVADVKLYWEFDLIKLQEELARILSACSKFVLRNIDDLNIDDVFPELIYKCYHLKDLQELYLLRQYILEQVMDYRVQNLLKLALTDTLRNAAAAGTGWPYIAPNKNTGDKPPKGALKIFTNTVWKIYRDLRIISRNQTECIIRNVLGDCRDKQELEDGQVTLSLTSPPYLNNYDYADRTRLETYFWGITKTWKDITSMFRDRLIIAATTQIVRSRYEVEKALSPEIASLDREVYQTIQNAVLELSRLRLTKGGKKDYDLMVALYFNDMVRVITETFRLIKPKGQFCVVIGDSAPYGVHIPTEQLIGKLGQAIGFSRYEYREFRTRGGKWKDNPQRHSVPLREGVIILSK